MWQTQTSLARACGAPIPFPMDGDMLLLYPLTLGDLGAIENYLLQSTLEASLAYEAVSFDNEGYLTEIQRTALANGTVVSLANVKAFLRARQGIQMSLWLCLRSQRSWKECAADIQRWEPNATAHFCVVRDTISGLNTLADHEWPHLPRKVLEEMERIGTLQEMSSKPRQWKQSMSIAADMGKCNFADLHQMTIFQYQILTSTPKRLDGTAELPQGWNAPSRHSKQGREVINSQRKQMQREIKNTPRGEAGLRLKGVSRKII